MKKIYVVLFRFDFGNGETVKTVTARSEYEEALKAVKDALENERKAWDGNGIEFSGYVLADAGGIYTEGISSTDGSFAEFTICETELG